MAACSEVIDDSLRFLTPPTMTERPSMPGFSRSCRFVLLWKRSIGWLLLRMSYAFQLMSARSNHAYSCDSTLKMEPNHGYRKMGGNSSMVCSTYSSQTRRTRKQKPEVMGRRDFAREGENSSFQ